MHGRVLLVLFLVYAEIAAFQTPENSRRTRARHERSGENTPRQCNFDQLHLQFRKLENQILDNTHRVISELKENNQRLQNLELKTESIEASLDSLETEFGHCDTRLKPKLDLEQGLQIAIAALRKVNSDIVTIKRNISAIAKTSYKNFRNNNIPENCQEWQDQGKNLSGIYQIQPELAPKPFLVLCDFSAMGGGWTYIHNRFEGTQNFHLDWNSYKLGFGNLGAEFWLGLEHLYQLTGSEVNELLVELEDMDKRRAFAYYTAFSVGSESEGYNLKVLGGYNGDAGDSLIYHGGSKFSTKDMDQDEWMEGNCAQAHGGAWWYRNCDKSNLNGRYLKGSVPEQFIYQGMYWDGFHGAGYSLGKARMMVRPRIKY